MKLSFNNDVVGLSAETDAEREICALLVAADRHVFQLHCTTDRGFAFTELGPEAEARREPLNITHAVESRFQPISNLAHTPFEVDGLVYASIEGFWQGLKFDDPARRRQIAKLSGASAKEAGKPGGQPPVFDFGGLCITAGSPEHWHLMRRACEAKFGQHRGAADALRASGARWLTHKVRRDSRTIPGAIMAQIWMDIRARMAEGDGS
jgi:predicted NAD-dependent protein-ADP-ribosyltransferase YbiA (DUF1768 family)